MQKIPISEIFKSWNKLKRSIMVSSRFKLNLFSNILGYQRRCEQQSKCAECARKLLALLRYFHTSFPHLDLNSEGSENSIEYKKMIMGILDLMYDANIPTSIHCHTDLKGNPKNVVLVAERFLSQHKCNVLAILILEEAILQFQDALKREIFFTSENISTIDNNILDSLELLIQEIKSPPYKSTVGIAILDERLRLFKLKFQGQGVLYLQELAKNQSLFGDKCLNQETY